MTGKLLLCAAGLVSFFWSANGTLAANPLEDVLSGFDTETESSPDIIPGDDSDILAGFDDPTKNTQTEELSAAILPDWLKLSGEFSLTSSWNYAQEAPADTQVDYRDLSMLRTTASLTADIRHDTWRARISGHSFYDGSYSLQGREQYSAKLLDEYEQELEFDEVYFSTSLLDSLDLKIGRQVVVWGKADNVRVTDILNPLDNRIPGMVDIKYRRLPVTMTRLDYFTGQWSMNALLLNEVRFDKTPVFNSDFFPGEGPRPPEKTPADFSINNQQYALAINGIFSGWDLSLYQAWVFDNRPHLSQETGQPELLHNRVSMTGFTSNMAFGNWLFKAEGAWWQGLEFATVSGTDFSRIDVMAGIEYTGFSETIFSLESVNRHIVHFDDRLRQAPDYSQQNEQQTVFMASRDFLNDTLNVKLLCSLFGGHGEDGGFERLQLSYDLNDHSTITGGSILYQSGEQYAFSTIGNNDRFFLEYSFSF